MELERKLASRPAAEWVGLLTQERVPAAQVNDIAGAFALAERLGLEPVASIERPDGTTARLSKSPIGLSATPVTYRSAPPDLGEPE